MSVKTGLGHCPVCGTPGVGCHRSPDGETWCANDHHYKHADRVYGVSEELFSYDPTLPEEVAYQGMAEQIEDLKSEIKRLKQWREAGMDVLAATDGDMLHDALIRLRRLKEGGE